MTRQEFADWEAQQRLYEYSMRIFDERLFARVLRLRDYLDQRDRDIARWIDDGGRC